LTSPGRQFALDLAPPEEVLGVLVVRVHDARDLHKLDTPAGPIVPHQKQHPHVLHKQEMSVRISKK
jgi:hypothetical protein